jgi:hypothetical protein
MTEWLSEFWASLTLGKVLIGVGIFAASIAFSFAAIIIVLVKLPANYFSSHYSRDFLPDSKWIVRWGAVIAKNLLGVVLILLGIVLSLPGRSWARILDHSARDHHARYSGQEANRS